MAMIKCPECAKDISDRSYNCIHCGFPLQDNKTETTTNKLEPNIVSSQMKNIGNNIKIVAIIAVSLMVICLAIGVKSNMLIGDDKIAYEKMLVAADSFKDPSSVRLVSGTVASDKESLFVGISAKNSYGSRTTSYYYVSSSGYIIEEEDEVLSFYKDKDKLNIDLINKKLEKKLALK